MQQIDLPKKYISPKNTFIYFKEYIYSYMYINMYKNYIQKQFIGWYLYD